MITDNVCEVISVSVLSTRKRDIYMTHHVSLEYSGPFRWVDEVGPGNRTRSMIERAANNCVSRSSRLRLPVKTTETLIPFHECIVFVVIKNIV